MANLRLVGAFLMLVLALCSEECHAEDFLKDLCKQMSNAFEEKYYGGNAIKKFALNWLTYGHISTVGDRNRLKSALATVLEEPKCSPTSLDLTATIGACRPDLIPALYPLAQATTRYISKCLTPTYLEHELLVEVGLNNLLEKKGSIIETFIDQQFVDDYRDVNPDENESGLAEIKFNRGEIFFPLAKVLERDAESRNKNVRQESSKMLDIEKFIKDNLVKPCEGYRKGLDDIMDKIDKSGRLALGGSSAALYKSLDQKYQMFILRRNFCTDLLNRFSLDPLKFALNIKKNLRRF